MMNFSNVIKKAQQMQKQMQVVQDEMANAEFSADAGNGAVKVVCDGRGRFKSIKISKEAINPENPSSVDDETVETLEDLISSAINRAAADATKEMEAKMKQATGGINIPGLF